ncbi:uncharacterized protein LOC119685631 [Teleopsis dalmanni]|uniref:uncharacterized protein LOC119685631 n=1 Tax=Teleopsis dalmanni TaxID=139649 RepID=UPI0018CD01C6|nr:uncharacterized protein LOC119685631 [Teleopsis dalmanni]
MKATVLLAIFALLAISANGASTNSSPSLNPFDYLNVADIAKKYIAAFKRIMPCGFAPWNLPPLAPYTVDHYAYNLTGDDYSLTGSFSNVYIEGLNDWIVLDLSYNTTTELLNFDVLYRNIQVLAEYTLNASVSIAGFPINYDGEGVVNWEYVDLRTVGSYKLETTSSNGLEMTNFNLQVLLGDIHNSDWNNYWNNDVNNFVNRFQREYGLLWIQQYQTYISDMYSEYVLPLLNSQIGNLSMTEFLETLVGLTMQLEEMPCTPSQ